MTFSLSCQEEPLATGVASTPALVLRRATPVPDLVDPALLPAGDASLFVAVSSILHPIQKRHCLIQGPDLKAEDLCRPSRIPFFVKRVQMTSSRVIDKMVVDEGRALQPCRYRLFTHMSCIILYPYST